MNAVDKSDHLISSYNCVKKCRRWEIKLLMHCVDISIVNSFILYKEWINLHPELKQSESITNILIFIYFHNLINLFYFS